MLDMGLDAGNPGAALDLSCSGFPTGLLDANSYERPASADEWAGDTGSKPESLTLNPTPYYKSIRLIGREPEAVASTKSFSPTCLAAQSSQQVALKPRSRTET